MVKVCLGSIHNLEIGPDVTPTVLKKLSRRYAMTGGYELSLRPGMSSVELGSLADTFMAELSEYSPQDMRYKTCNAYRILRLLGEMAELPQECLERLDREVFSVADR